METRQDFAYGRTFFYVRAVLYAILFVFLLLFLALQTVTPPSWIALLGGILFAYLAVVGVSPLLTRHTLTRSRITIRQGLYFRTTVPIPAAASIGPWDGEPKYGLKLSTARGILFVVGSGQNLVSVKLKEPRRFPQVFFLAAKEVVFDVGDRDGFLAAVEARRSAAEELPAKKLLTLPPRR